jgi:Cu/Ag efflux pump CusA
VIKVSSSLGRAVTSRTIPGPYEGQLWISLDPNADYARTMAQVRDVTKGYVGVVQNAQTYLQGSVSHKLVEPSDRMTVRVFGAEEPVIREKALEIANALKERPGVTAAIVAPRVDAPAIEIETDLAKAEEHGLKPGDVPAPCPRFSAASRSATCSRIRKSSAWWCGANRTSGRVSPMSANF